MAFRSEHREWLDEIARGPARPNLALYALKFAVLAAVIFGACSILWRLG